MHRKPFHKAIQTLNSHYPQILEKKSYPLGKVKKINNKNPMNQGQI